MTKAELIRALAPYPDSADVVVWMPGWNSITMENESGYKDVVTVSATFKGDRIELEYE